MSHSDHLGEFEALVLAAVVRAGSRANGTGVYQAIAERVDRDVSLPSVHVTLRRLEEKRLLASEVGTRSDRGGRPRRFYRATAAGVEALRIFRDTWRRVWRGLELPEPGGRQ